MRSVQSRFGECWYYGKDEFVGKSIHNYGEFSGDETEKIVSLAKGLCLDIGANIGWMTMALLANGFEVQAFEPQPEIYKLLIKNCPKAVCHNVALSSKPGTAKMPRVRYGAKGNYGGLGIGYRSELGTIDVKCITLDSLELQNVGFMKIDVEGHELEMLKGAADTIRRCKPILYVEDDRPQNREALRKFIRELGYSIQEHKPFMFRENNFFNNKENVWGKQYISENLICLP